MTSILPISLGINVKYNHYQEDDLKEGKGEALSKSSISK